MWNIRPFNKASGYNANRKRQCYIEIIVCPRARERINGVDVCYQFRIPEACFTHPSLSATKEVHTENENNF